MFSRARSASKSSPAIIGMLVRHEAKDQKLQVTLSIEIVIGDEVSIIVIPCIFALPEEMTLPTCGYHMVWVPAKDLRVGMQKGIQSKHTANERNQIVLCTIC